MDGCNQHSSPVNAIYELFAECRCLSPISGLCPGRPVLPVASEPCAVRRAQAVRWRPGETQHIVYSDHTDHGGHQGAPVSL